MPHHNQVTLMGNVVRDPSIKATNSGGSIAHFTLGITRRWTTESGEKKEEATFVDIDAFGKTAGVIEKFVRKGDPLFVNGRLKLDQWDDKQSGQKRSKLSVIAEGVQLLSRPDQAQGAAPQPSAAAPVQAPTNRPSNGDDEVPF